MQKKSKKVQLVEFNAEMTKKYGTPDFTKMMTEREFWKYYHLKGGPRYKPDYQPYGYKNPSVSYKRSGIH